MRNKINILTDGWGEILIYQLQKKLSSYFYIERLNIGLLGKKSFDGGDFKNSFLMRKFEDDSRFMILHYNNWLDPIICKIPKNKITIFESHSIHFGLDLKNALYILDTPLKKNIGFFIHFIYKIFFFFKIKKFDLYFTSIPSALPYAKKIRSDTIWLPNAIDFELFDKEFNTIKLDKKYINIFLPTSVRIIKNQTKVWKIIDNLSQKYKNIKIYIIKYPISNYKLINKYLKKYKDNIIWLPLIKRELIGKYYKADWNLVLGSMWPYKNYSMLNMIELELMACKAPVVAMDSFEIIKTKYDDIEKLSWKVLKNKDFRNYYIKKNYNYVKNIHSLENVSKIYLENLKPFLEDKLGIINNY